MSAPGPKGPRPRERHRKDAQFGEELTERLPSELLSCQVHLVEKANPRRALEPARVDDRVKEDLGLNELCRWVEVSSCYRRAGEMMQATHSIDLLVLVQALVVFAYRDLWTGVTERESAASRTQRRVNEGRTMKMSALTSEKQLCAGRGRGQSALPGRRSGVRGQRTGSTSCAPNAGRRRQRYGSCQCDPRGQLPDCKC
jgi:hypothetical protein